MNAAAGAVVALIMQVLQALGGEEDFAFSLPGSTSPEGQPARAKAES